MTTVAEFATRALDSLSGGERQRAWLSMLMAQKAECLLLDEPTSALDIAHQLDVLTLIHGLALAQQVGVVIVLHDVNLAARFCDEIVALRAGRIVASGTPDAIMRPEVLQRIYSVELDVLQAAGRKLAFAR